MTFNDNAKPAKTGILSTLGDFARNRRGVAAMEFAIIAPILFAMYFLTLEFGQAIDVNKKVSRAANMAADLVAQQPSITAGEIDAIMKIGGAIMKPYNRSTPTVTLTAIQVTDERNPRVEVVWSRELKNGTTSAGLKAGSTTTLPPELEIRGAFYVRATVSLGYKPILTWSKDGAKATGVSAMIGLDNLQMSERFHLRPRMSSTIPCDDC